MPPDVRRGSYPLPLAAAAASAGGAVSLMEYQRALLRARAYRTESRQLAVQVRRMTVRVVKLKRVAGALSAALEEERAKRRELQAAVQQAVANREAAEAEEDTEMEEVEKVEEALPAPPPARVVVVLPNGPAQREMDKVEYAGSVVVVRGAAPAPAPATAPKPSAGACNGMPTPVAPPASARKTPVVVLSVARKGTTPSLVPTSARCTPATGLHKSAKKTPSEWAGDGLLPAARTCWSNMCLVPPHRNHWNHLSPPS